MSVVPEILPGTGRGTTKWWRGRLKLVSNADVCALPNPTPPSLRATSPFRGGFSVLRAFASSRETNFLFSSREVAKTRRNGDSINSFAFAIALGLSTFTSAANACEPQPKEHLLHVSDTVVVGQATVVLKSANSGGALKVSRRINGSKLAAIEIKLENSDRNASCPNSWLPLKSGTYSGTFYLRRLSKGRFGVIKFLPTKLEK